MPHEDEPSVAMSLHRSLSHSSAALLSTLLRVGSKPHECRSLLVRLSFDPPNFLRHDSMHLLSHQVSAKLLLRLEPEWLRQTVRLLIFRAQILKSNDPVLDVVDQVVDTTREMLGAPVSACLLGRQRDHRLVVFADVCWVVYARRNPSDLFPIWPPLYLPRRHLLPPHMLTAAGS